MALCKTENGKNRIKIKQTRFGFSAGAVVMFATQRGTMDTKLLEQLTIELMSKNNVNLDSGAKNSIKCQYAQLENMIRDAIIEMKISAISDMQSSYDTDNFNGKHDGSEPLICFDTAKSAVNDFLET